MMKQKGIMKLKVMLQVVLVVLSGLSSYAMVPPQDGSKVDTKPLHQHSELFGCIFSSIAECNIEKLGQQLSSIKDLQLFMYTEAPYDKTLLQIAVWYVGQPSEGDRLDARKSMVMMLIEKINNLGGGSALGLQLKRFDQSIVALLLKNEEAQVAFDEVDQLIALAEDPDKKVGRVPNDHGNGA